MASQSPCKSAPSTPSTPSTTQALLDLLRRCPTDHLPANDEPTESDLEAPMPAPRKTTAFGTPCARSWNDSWLAVVNAAETRLGRRICGARLVDNTPCELPSDHPSGRCRFHGGFDLTGAPPENRNAYIHGLYSRRLKTCGDHCPQWSVCPFVDAQLESIPLAKRPTCPYEQAQYNTALADALYLAVRIKEKDPFHIHIAHNVALLQVLLGRAALELRNRTITTQTRAKSANYSLDQQQVSPLITAIGRIGSELRKYHAMLAKPAPNDWRKGFDADDVANQLRDTQPGPEPHQFAVTVVDGRPIELRRNHARHELIEAVKQARKGHDKKAFECWQAANFEEPNFAEQWTDSLKHILESQSKPPP